MEGAGGPSEEGHTISMQMVRVQTDADFHTLNEFDEQGQAFANREDVVDDCTAGFLIQISLEKAIHATSPKPTSFIGLKFRFDGVNEKRRFTFVEITVRFEDMDQPLKLDPVVETLWPDGDYTLSSMGTQIAVQKTVGGGGTVGGGMGGIEASGEMKGETQQSFSKADRAALVGAKVRRERMSGSKNAVLLKVYENETTGSGVLREFRSGILLKRRNPGPHKFRAIFSVRAKADMRYAAQKGLYKLLGKAYLTDPVILNPTENFYGVGDAASINQDVPGPEMVAKYGGVVPTTVL